MLPGPPRSSGDFGVNLQNSLKSHDLDEDDLAFLGNHVASGTSWCYSYAFKHIDDFCIEKNTSPYTCSPAIIVKYLRLKYDSGASYSSINLIRSAISKFHEGYLGM